METVTITQDEYKRLKHYEKIAQDEVLLSIRRGLQDAVRVR
mgnify:CR=1 FL=1